MVELVVCKKDSYFDSVTLMTLSSKLKKLPGVGDAAVASWAETSCRIVRREGFYPPLGALAPSYLKRWQPTADAQLRLGAERLARLLNRAS